MRYLAAAVAVWVWGAASAPAQYVSGEFTYQITDQTGLVNLNGTTQVANQLVSGAPNATPTANSWFVFRVYLVQNAGPGPSIDTIGVSGAAARINYANVGGVGTPKAKVPVANSANIVNNPNYDLVARYGASNGTDTTNSAALQVALQANNDTVPLPGDLGDTRRMLIGTFKMQGQGSAGQVNVQVLDPFFPNINDQTGPNPPASDGTLGGPGAGPVIYLDSFLTDYAPPPSFASFTLTVVPEPTSLALGGLAAIGLLGVRRKKKAVAV